MGCACKAGRDLSYLEKKYGEHFPQSKISHIGNKIVGDIETFFLTILILPIVPILLIGSIVKSIFKKEKTVNINEVFKIKKNVRNK